MLLVTGIAWLIISVVLLRFTVTAAATIGILLGAVFLAAMVNEFLLASVRRRWGWAHVLMGIVFLAGAIWAFVNPIGTFWALATVIGLLLILQGALVLVTSIESRIVNGAWWLGVVAGILEILIGFWASQQLVPARAVLLIIWVGVLALFRGITEIVVAFELKAAPHAAGRPNSDLGPKMGNSNAKVVYAAAYDNIPAAMISLEAVQQLHRDQVIGPYDAAVIDKDNGKARIIKRMDRPRIRAIPESLGSGTLPRKELKEAAEGLTDSEAGLVVVGEPTIEKALDAAITNATKVVKRTVDATTDEIASELREALKA
jgi:uncharacterized membrane protein HdeD (DUF308 family)